MAESLLAALRESPEKLSSHTKSRREIRKNKGKEEVDGGVRKYADIRQKFPFELHKAMRSTYELPEKAETEPMEAMMATAENFILTIYILYLTKVMRMEERRRF